MLRIYKYIGITVLALVVFLLVRSWIRKAKARKEQREKQNLSQAALSGTLTPEQQAEVEWMLQDGRLSADAETIYKELGLDLFFGLEWPSVDEEGVLDVLEQYNLSSYQALALKYYEKYNKSLTSDLQRRMPDEWPEIAARLGLS